MKISGDWVLEEQNIWNIQDGVKKVIAGLVTISLLVGISDAVCVIPSQEKVSVYNRTVSEMVQWGAPTQMGQMAKEESIRIYAMAQVKPNVQAETVVESAALQEESAEQEEFVPISIEQPVISETVPEEIIEIAPEEEAILEENPAEEYFYYQGFKIDQEGMICGFDPANSLMADGYLELPSEHCIGIRRGTFSGVGAGIFEIYIPDCIQNIENGAFSELSELTWIEAEGAGEYTARDGILFSGTELVVFPAGRIGIFEMPEDVTAIGESAFANTNLDKIDMRNCTSIVYDEGIFGGGAGCEILEGENGL